MVTLRTLTAFTVLGLVVVGGAGPAAAHGGLAHPVSRAMACGPEGGSAAKSAACRAATDASEPGAFREWDVVRVGGVRGRDRERIPDGKLCSAGVARYAGLDLPRTDWPVTRLRSGAGFTFAYRGTLPHRGTFRLYVTEDRYRPSKPLSWSDLEPKPFLTATDPPLSDGSYHFTGRLPAGKTGHHVIYTIWENSNTPDTYYSCSDVVFRGPSTRAGGAGGAKTTPKGAQEPPAVLGEAPAAAPAPAAEATPVSHYRGDLPRVVAFAALGAAAVAVLALLVVRRRRRT